MHNEVNIKIFPDKLCNEACAIRSFVTNDPEIIIIVSLSLMGQKQRFLELGLRNTRMLIV